MMPQIMFDEERALANIKNYFRAYCGPAFDAGQWFTPKVDFFFHLTNVSPEQITAQVRQDKLEYIKPEITVTSRANRLTTSDNGEQSCESDAHYACIRQSKSGLIESYDATYRFVFYNGKIKSITLVSKRNEKLEDPML